MANEKTFQTYFMKLLPHGYRTSLVNGSGFPDCLAIRREEHFMVELKMLNIGPSGNKMLRGLYKPSQLPWHLDYLYKGGTRLYTIFKLDGKYGIIHENMGYIKDVVAGLKYLDMWNIPSPYTYREYKSLKELVDVCFR